MPGTSSALVRRFYVNEKGRDLIVGDVHGNFSKLRLALDAVSFNPDAGDRLFSVGDLVDRGPESDLALSWLAYPWFFTVSGNHESMAIMWAAGGVDPRQYRANGGGWNIENPASLSRAISQALQRLPIAIEIETPDGLVGIVHAECPAASWPAFVAALESPLTSEMERLHLRTMAQWMRNRIDRLDDDNIAGVRAVVVGHTPVRQWTSLGNTIFIDTGAWLPEHDNPGPFLLLDAKTLRPAQPQSLL